uniref:Uncharacterized protein n=1 Tax=Aegilops tauschii subsp. strangulata TaxID=200361 RepID=A0A453S0T9_AEGTS
TKVERRWPSDASIMEIVALLGWAKPFQKELNEIAERVQASNKHSYKFMLTETICSLSRHRDCCVFSSLSVNVKNGADTWEAHFDKLSIKERSKFDEETLYNLEGIKRTKEYSKKLDGSRNEYIVVTILVAAKGALKFPKIRRPADLEAVVEKLNSIPNREIRVWKMFLSFFIIYTSAASCLIEISGRQSYPCHFSPNIADNNKLPFCACFLRAFMFYGLLKMRMTFFPKRSFERIILI